MAALFQLAAPVITLLAISTAAAEPNPKPSRCTTGSMNMAGEIMYVRKVNMSGPRMKDMPIGYAPSTAIIATRTHGVLRGPNATTPTYPTAKTALPDSTSTDCQRGRSGLNASVIGWAR